MVGTHFWLLCPSHIYSAKKKSAQDTKGLTEYEDKKLHYKSRLTSTWICLSSFRKYSGSAEVCLAMDQRTKEELEIVWVGLW